MKLSKIFVKINKRTCTFIRHLRVVLDETRACGRISKYGVLFQAEKCIREQLAVRETATLWNLLGDATMVRPFCENPL